MILLNLNLILNLKALRGLIYIKLLCEKIRLTKKVFLASVEQGLETFIPRELGMDHLPMSFKYYDPVLAIVAEDMSVETRTILAERQFLAKKLHFD